MSSPNGKTYCLILYDISKPKGASMAMQKEITQNDARMIFDNEGALITCDENRRYKVVEKRIFVHKETTFIIVDGLKQKLWEK